jgi:hypothetical protein
MLPSLAILDAIFFDCSRHQSYQASDAQTNKLSHKAKAKAKAANKEFQRRPSQWL